MQLFCRCLSPPGQRLENDFICRWWLVVVPRVFYINWSWDPRRERTLSTSKNGLNCYKLYKLSSRSRHTFTDLPMSWIFFNLASNIKFGDRYKIEQTVTFSLKMKKELGLIGYIFIFENVLKPKAQVQFCILCLFWVNDVIMTLHPYFCYEAKY